MHSTISWCISSSIVFCCLSLSGGENLVANGSFSDSSAGWEYLLQAGSAKATGSVENGIYSIKISEASNEAWHVQLRQKGIKLFKKESYRFSFDAWAAKNRAIEASVGMENGPYTVYTFPLLNKFNLTTEKRRFTSHFFMLDSCDTNARVQFNCGFSAIDVYIDNVSLEKITEPAMILLSPNGGEKWCSNSMKDIRWVGVSMQKVSLAYSTDAGLHWNPIAKVDNTGIFPWKVPPLTEAWCFIRITDAENCKVNDQSKTQFEIGSFFNLVLDGGFNKPGSSDWNSLGVFGNARARGAYTGGEYVITVDTAGAEPWNVQFTQNGISLVQQEEYVLSFDAYADAPRPLQANIGQSGEGYLTYLGDTAKGNIELTTFRRMYRIDFKMIKPSDVNARLEFNAGTASGVVHIDNITLYNKNQPPIINMPFAPYCAAAGSVEFLLKGAGFPQTYSVPLRGPVRYAAVFDLKGKLVRTLKTDAMRLEWDCRSDRAAVASPGRYILRVRGDAGMTAISIVLPGG